MLIILGGLPGTGKTTISKALAKKLPALHLRIDTIESAIKSSHLQYEEDMMDAGYLVAYDVAVDNLMLGHNVIADSVNPISITRDAWRKAAERAKVEFIEVEFLCSDNDEHKNRVETRKSDIKNLVPPTWQKVVDREYEPWDLQGLKINTAGKSVDACVEEILSYIKK